MRSLTSHRVNECNKCLVVEAADGPGPGGASHHYAISGYDTAHNVSDPTLTMGNGQKQTDIFFQNGAIKEAGVNGITNEALLAIVIDRLEGFQSGPYKCRENACALTKLEEAVHWLHHRTVQREQRGVEGTMAI